ncbi:MAG: MOSC domain-containing protein [Vicinamibacterales bacterium]
MSSNAGITHLTSEQLDAGLEDIRRAPSDEGVLRLIVRRPAEGVREILDEAELNLTEGLAGDTWARRGSSRTPDGSRHPDMQLNVMSSRVVALLAQSPDRWALAGDQLYVDFDLSETNLPPGTQLAIGSAVIEVTREPHTGCRKFVERFGLDAMKFVNAPSGKLLRLRGLNARVVVPGAIRAGDIVRKSSGAR